MKNKRGLSEVITTVLMIVLVVASVAMVWFAINQLTTKKLSEVKSCFDVNGKISLEHAKTCYASTNKEVQAYISVSDIELEAILVTISTEDAGKSFKLIKDGTSESFLKYAKEGSSYGESVQMPGKGEGIKYIISLNEMGLNPLKGAGIKITPIVNGENCEVADSISAISAC